MSALFLFGKNLIDDLFMTIGSFGLDRKEWFLWFSLGELIFRRLCRSSDWFTY